MKQAFHNLVTEVKRTSKSLIGIEETDDLQTAGYCYVFEDRKTLIKIKNYSLPENEAYERKIAVLLHEWKHVQDIESKSPTSEVASHRFVLEQCRLRGFDASFKFYKSWLEWLTANGLLKDAEAAKQALTMD